MCHLTSYSQDPLSAQNILGVQKQGTRWKLKWWNSESFWEDTASLQFLCMCPEMLLASSNHVFFFSLTMSSLNLILHSHPPTISYTHQTHVQLYILFILFHFQILKEKAQSPNFFFSSPAAKPFYHQSPEPLSMKLEAILRYLFFYFFFFMIQHEQQL